MLADALPVAASVLRRRLRGLVLWTVAIAAVNGMYMAFWPAFDVEEMQALIQGMPEALVTAMGYDRIGSAAGYLESTAFGLIAPALMLVFAIAAGARLVAGEEEDGTLELELAAPVARRRVLAERLAVLVFSVVVLAAGLAVVAVLAVAGFDMDVAMSALVATSTGLALMVIAFGAVTLAVGAVTGRRGAALAVGAGLAVVSYVADAVAPLVDWGGALEAASPFSWYLGSDPLKEGWDLGGLVALAVVAVVAALVGLVAFDRRDVGV